MISVAFGAALIENLPDAFVAVPLEVPFTVTLAPLIGVPVSAVTVPLTMVSWALRPMDHNVINPKNNKSFNL